VTDLREAFEGYAVEPGGGDPGGNPRAYHHDLQASAESAADPVAAISRFANGVALLRYEPLAVN